MLVVVCEIAFAHCRYQSEGFGAASSVRVVCCFLGLTFTIHTNREFYGRSSFLCLTTQDSITSQPPHYSASIRLGTEIF